MLSLYKLSKKLKSKGGLYDVYKNPSYSKRKVYDALVASYDFVFILSYNNFTFTAGALSRENDSIYFTKITPTKRTTIKLSEDFYK